MADSRKANSVDLLNHQSDWGLTVSEASARKSAGKRMMVFGAYILCGAASLLAMPLIAGALFFPSSDGLLFEFAIVAFCLLLAMAFKFQADKQMRNAVQVDYRAAELRLGSEKKDGTFVREKVFSFRDIENVQVKHVDDGTPRLSLMIDGNDVAIAFNGTDLSSVEGLAVQIAAARESALRAPIRSRVQSKIHGIEASFREVKSRVRSTIVHA